MTINLALACVEAMQTTATATTNQTNTTSDLTALDAKIVTKFISQQTTRDTDGKQNIADWLAEINNAILDMAGKDPTSAAYQTDVQKISADTTKIQAQQAVVQSIEQQADTPVQTAQTLTSALSGNITQLNGFMQSVNQAQTSLSSLLASPV